jgi:radical SAM superfamily enzyme YgiQ (UPF0313 family)
MKIGLMAMSGVRVKNQRLVELGVTLPQFVSRGKVIAQLPSLSLLTLAALTPEEIEVEYVEVPDIGQVEELDTGYDAVAISSYSAQIFEAYELADRYRDAGVPVVIGGSHVSALPAEAAEHADAVAVGEAEALWPRIVDDLLGGRLEPIYRESKPGTTDLAGSPVPRFDLLDPKRYNRITVQTSRGCPHDCEFCAGSKLFGAGFRQKPVDRIVTELELVSRLWPRPFVELADDNSFVDKRWSRELMEAIRPMGLRWFTETDISVADDEELLELMYHNGCYQLLIGLESTRRESLAGLDRHGWKSRQADRYMEAIQKIQAHGISVNGCFIVGLDGDTTGIFEEIRDFIVDSQLLEAQVTVLTPYPGTRLYSRLEQEGRLLADCRWDLCTMFDVNFRPARMDPEELEAGLAWLYGEIYNEHEFLRRKRHYMDLMKDLPGRAQ